MTGQISVCNWLTFTGFLGLHTHTQSCKVNLCSFSELISCRGIEAASHYRRMFPEIFTFILVQVVFEPLTNSACISITLPGHLCSEISRGSGIFNNSLAVSYTCCNTCPAARSTVYAWLWIMIDQMVGTSHSACAVAVTVVPLWHHCPLLWKVLLRRGLHVSTWVGRTREVQMCRK